MHAVILGQLLLAGTVEFDRPQLLFARIAFVRDVINHSRCRIHRLDRRHLAVAIRELPHQLRLTRHRVGFIEAVEIDLRVPIAPARPQYVRPADRHVVVFVEELCVRLLQSQLRAAIGRVGEVQPAMLMVARECLDPQRVRVQPAEARNVIVAGSERHLHPVDVGGAYIHHAHAHRRVGIARLRIALHRHCRVRRDPVGDRILRHRRLVRLQKSDRLRVRRPEVIAAHIQLFQVQPVHLAVQHRGIARHGEPHRGLGRR